jgi:serine/threonine protein phosphatase 1
MIGGLAGLFRRAPVATYRVPPGLRVYAIGDVHGRLDLLDRLLAMVDADDAARGPGCEVVLIFLGDLVDRGPGSAQVVERLRTLAVERPTTRFLKGNHEELFLAALAGDGQAMRTFRRVGGEATLVSYGLAAEVVAASGDDELVGLALDAVPAADIAFLDGFEDGVIVGDYGFVHAGVRPGRAFADQHPDDLRWIRGGFLDHRGPFGKRIVHGHTIVPDIEVRPHRIGIDTGAYRSGRLSALGLQDDRVWTLQT